MKCVVDTCVSYQAFETNVKKKHLKKKLKEHKNCLFHIWYTQRSFYMYV